MRGYGELAAELARVCARQARLTKREDEADELWRMAQNYHKRAADLDSDLPDIGEKPAKRQSFLSADKLLRVPFISRSSSYRRRA
jgi:hypothetical protein